MKILGFVAALATAIVLAFVASGSLTTGATPGAQADAPTRPLLFVPGLLGSRLCRPGPDGAETVVWGTTDAFSQFPSLALAGETDIVPCGLIREISFLGVLTQQVYGPFLDRLEEAGYREGETLFVFDYDWRLSVLDNAERLSRFIEAELPDGRFDVVGHSMGGLIARTYAMEAGDGRIGRLVTAGSPWRGSVQVFELMRHGWGLASGLLGGVENFRRTIISWPSTFELMPSYEGCCTGDGGFVAGSPETWAALNWPGVEVAALPDLGEVERRQVALQKVFDAPLPAGIEDAMVVGVDQRTPEHFALTTGAGEAELTVRTSWDGDGTVLRDSAVLGDRVVYPTSFATHDAILNDTSVQDFVLTTLRQGAEAALAAVPVKPRDEILTALGQAVQLIGVAVATDQPAYQAGTTGRLTVHLRLPTQDAVAPTTLEATITPPGGAPLRLDLQPDPSASDPTNPFEQSYSATFDTGARPGELIATATLRTADGAPRTVTRSIPVVGR